MELKLIDIRGIGASTAKTLAGHGFEKVSDVANADLAKMVGVPGFGKPRAADVIAAAVALLAAGNSSEAIQINSTSTPVKKKEGKESKKKSKKAKVKLSKKNGKSKNGNKSKNSSKKNGRKKTNKKKRKK